MTATAVAIVLHLLAAVIWVGGMFFAHMALRPSVAVLEPKDRLALWRGVFPRFFRWVWGAVVVLLGTGYWLVYSVYGGFGVAGLHIHLMSGIGTLMAVLFAFLYAVPYRAFRAAVDGGDLKTAAAQQARVRHIITVNLVLGLITVMIGGLGGYLG